MGNRKPDKAELRDGLHDVLGLWLIELHAGVDRFALEDDATVDADVRHAERCERVARLVDKQTIRSCGEIT